MVRGGLKGARGSMEKAEGDWIWAAIGFVGAVGARSAAPRRTDTPVYFVSRPMAIVR